MILNFLGYRERILGYSCNFIGISLNSIIGNNKTKKFNFVLQELAFVQLTFHIGFLQSSKNYVQISYSSPLLNMMMTSMYKKHILPKIAGVFS